MPAPARPVRVPLVVGLAALRSQVRVALLAWPGLFILLATVPAAAFLNRAIHAPFLRMGAAILGAAVLVLGGLFMWAWTATSTEEARRARPSDLVLDGDGLSVEGGPRHGLTVPWAEVADLTVAPVAPEKLGLRQRLLAVLTLGLTLRRSGAARPPRQTVHELRLTRRSGEPVVLAASDDLEEVDAFRALAEAIQALAAEEAPVEAPPADPPAVGGPPLFRCRECDVALAPVDDEAAICPACAAANPMPDELLARLRAPAEVARGRRAERLVARVLTQPRLRAARMWLGAVRWTGRLVWPLGLGAFFVLALVQESRSRNYPVALVTTGYVSPYRYDAALGLAVVLAVIAGVAVTAAAFLATRRSLCLVSLRFGAVAPAGGRVAPACRACGAPLPERPGRLVIGCLHCAADNVLGDATTLASRERSRGQSRSVEAALIHRRRARQRLAMIAASSVLLLFLLGRELVLATAWAPSRAPFSPCVICTRASFRNLEEGRQLITISMGALSRRFVVPGRAGFDVECLGDCTVELGRQHLTVADVPDPFDERPGPFEIREGRLVEAQVP